VPGAVGVAVPLVPGGAPVGGVEAGAEPGDPTGVAGDGRHARRHRARSDGPVRTAAGIGGTSGWLPALNNIRRSGRHKGR
jgi:hypothetical protein